MDKDTQPDDQTPDTSKSESVDSGANSSDKKPTELKPDPKAIETASENAEASLPEELESSDVNSPLEVTDSESREADTHEAAEDLASAEVETSEPKATVEDPGDDSSSEAAEESVSEESAPQPEASEGVDLSALQGFDFGTSWSESKPSSGGGRSQDRGPRRSDRRPRGDRSDRKDRRPFKPGGFRKGGPRDRDDSRERSHRPHTPGRRFGDRPDIPKKVVEVSFYPEDNGFKALCKALRVSTITYELFDIARTILEKEERFYMTVRPMEAAGEGEENRDTYLFVAKSDGLPFLSEDLAFQHCLSNCLEHFFTTETKEVDPPSGSFTTIQKCGLTGELLGPPNYHRIKTILADHHASRLAHMPYARFESRLESVKEEEAVAEWLEKMKTQTSYTLKPEFGEPRSFEDGETARAYVKAQLSEKMVRKLKSVRLEGHQISKVTDRLLKANLEFAWERQKRFPLDTANLLRGRLRRQKFALYKKGSKGVSYVCAVKRRFREPGQVFSEPVEKLIEFLEGHPNISVKELPEKYLGFATHAVEGEPPIELTDEQETQIKALNLDLQWLLKEGYIAEYSDGSLILQPATSAAQTASPKEAAPKAGEQPIEKAEGPDPEPVGEKDQSHNELKEGAAASESQATAPLPEGQVAPDSVSPTATTADEKKKDEGQPVPEAVESSSGKAEEAEELQSEEEAQVSEATAVTGDLLGESTQDIEQSKESNRKSEPASQVAEPIAAPAAEEVSEIAMDESSEMAPEEIAKDASSDTAKSENEGPEPDKEEETEVEPNPDVTAEKGGSTDSTDPADEVSSEDQTGKTKIRKD